MVLRGGGECEAARRADGGDRGCRSSWVLAPQDGVNTSLRAGVSPSSLQLILL